MGNDSYVWGLSNRWNRQKIFTIQPKLPGIYHFSGLNCSRAGKGFAGTSCDSLVGGHRKEKEWRRGLVLWGFPRAVGGDNSRAMEREGWLFRRLTDGCHSAVMHRASVQPATIQSYRIRHEASNIADAAQNAQSIFAERFNAFALRLEHGGDRERHRRMRATLHQRLGTDLPNHDRQLNGVQHHQPWRAC
jgi:hypothetical protein